MIFGFFSSLFNDVLHDIINRVTNKKRNIKLGKIKWLNKNFSDVYSPQIDYKKEENFKTILNEIKSFIQ